MIWKKDKTYKFVGGNSESWVNNRNETLLVSKEPRGWVVTKEKGYRGTELLATFGSKTQAVNWAKIHMRGRR